MTKEKVVDLPQKKIPTLKMASLKKPTPSIEHYVRELSTTVRLSLKDLDLSNDIEIPKGLSRSQMKKIIKGEKEWAF